MPSAAPENAPLIKWSGEAFRLIPSRFPPVNVYEGLIANDRQDEIVAVENLTNPRLRSLSRLQQTTQGDVSADPRLQNWNLAPFAYGNPDGSTFFGGDRPCLEVALERQTALAVSVAKRQTFMEATREAPIGLDMRMLCTPVNGTFWDLRDVSRLPSELDKKQRYELGAKMPEDAQGILYHPVERPAGTCLVIVTGDVLQRSQQTVHFRYVWDGKRISQLYAFDKVGTPIDADALASENDVLAAA
jgi:RES domain-containing protein